MESNRRGIVPRSMRLGARLWCALPGISTVRIEEDTHTPVSGGKYLSFMSLQEEVGAKLLLAFYLSVDIS